MKRLFSFLVVITITAALLSSCENKDASSVLQSSTDTTTVTTTTLALNTDEAVNMLSNGDFSDGTTTGWNVFTQTGTGEISIVDNMLEIDIANAGTLDYAVQLYQDGFKLDQGCKYKLTFEAKATIDRSFEARIQLNGGDYHAYASLLPELTAQTNEYVLEFTMEEASDPSPRLAINLGKPNDLDAMEPHKVYFDNFVLECTDDSGKIDADSDTASMNININQLGYLPSDKKTAIFRDVTTDTSFNVINVETGEVAFSGEIYGSIVNSTASETNSYGDFSELTASGKYKITTESLGESFEFEIGDKIYDAAFAAVVKMLYLQRCGTELPEEYEGDFAHAACHTAEATIFGTSTKIDVSGGWHDAGDYGRYVVPGSKTVADLILAYQENPTAFTDDTGLPQSGNGIPDIIDEIKYELDWLLKMQDDASGGVYHKVTCTNFPATVMPEEETDELIVSPISDAATADFAAVTAMSSSLFKEYSGDYSSILLEASKNAWNYLSAKNTLTGFTNPDGIVTGEYGDADLSDEMFWAAAELFKVTGNSVYHDYLKQSYSSKMKGLGWADVGSFGVFAYLTTDSTKVDQSLFASMKSDMLSYADELVEASKADGYMISLTKYPWGSNMTVANNAMLLILADKISPNVEYTEYAAEHFNYIFGANPMSYCYVTGFGSLSPEHPHHRPSEVIGSAMPGMLIGGPNQNLEDPYAQSVLADAPPAKCYADNSQSYSCNEITIYWNSPLIFVMSSTLD